MFVVVDNRQNQLYVWPIELIDSGLPAHKRLPGCCPPDDMLLVVIINTTQVIRSLSIDPHDKLIINLHISINRVFCRGVSGRIRFFSVIYSWSIDLRGACSESGQVHYETS